MSGGLTVIPGALAQFFLPDYAPKIWVSLAFVSLAVWSYSTWARERQKVLELEDRLNPKITIEIDGPSSMAGDNYTFYARMKNVGDKNFENCQLKLHGFNISDPFSLRPGEPILRKILFFSRANSGLRFENWIRNKETGKYALDTRKDPPLILGGGEHEIVLVANDMKEITTVIEISLNDENIWELVT